MISDPKCCLLTGLGTHVHDIGPKVWLTNTPLIGIVKIIKDRYLKDGDVSFRILFRFQNLLLYTSENNEQNFNPRKGGANL